MPKEFNFTNLVSNTSGNTVIKTDNTMLEAIANNEELPIKNLKADKLDVIEDQPFHPYDDDAFEELKESINDNGLYSPLIVNKNGNRYTILGGRNRYNACVALGWDKIPCKIVDVDEATANLIMVDSNLNQRQELLPSEKAYAYQIKIESLASIKSTSLTKSVEELANSENTTERSVYKYLRLAKLVKPLLGFVDEKIVTVGAGVILADLDNTEQKILTGFIQENNKKINEKKAESIVEIKGNVTTAALEEIFIPKPKERDKVKVDFTRLGSVLKDCEEMTDEEIEDYIINAIDFYNQHSND